VSIFLYLLLRLSNLLISVLLPLVLYFCTIYVQGLSWKWMGDISCWKLFEGSLCKPIDWSSECPSGQTPRNLSDLTGGYLSGPTGEIYDRYCLLSTGDINNFYIDISKEHEYKNLCRVMNKLQCQAFKINCDWLKYILDYENSLVSYGYLMPRTKIKDLACFKFVAFKSAMLLLE
jgi:hypothetical protein